VAGAAADAAALVTASAADPAEDVAAVVDCCEQPAKSIAVVAVTATTRFFLCSMSVPP
jgi:hypothetical protein